MNSASDIREGICTIVIGSGTIDVSSNQDGFTVNPESPQGGTKAL